MKRFSNIAGIVSGIAGGSILLLFFFFLQVGFVISAVIGLAGFAGTYLLAYAFKPKAELNFDIRGSITEAEINRTLKEGDEKVKRLQSYTALVSNAAVREKLVQIILMVKDIFGNIKKDPKNIRNAKQFLSYYLDTTINIVKKYTELSAQNVHTPEIQGTLLKAESMLGSIENAFQEQKARLLRDDVMELDVEIGTLEKTLIAEGLK